MKSAFFIVLASLIAVVAGTIIYLNWKEAPTTPAPVAELPVGGTITPPPEIVVPERDPSAEPPPVASRNLEEPAQVSLETPPSDDAPPANPAPPPTPFDDAINLLVSPQATFSQKQATLKQLRDAGQLDQAIEALERGALENPTSAAYPATLGQAQLQKAGVIAQRGGKISEMGILGMQADQNFDAALNLDPANWEAQFFKAAAMSHWPLELNKGEEVIQKLSSLVDQQETMPPEPQFAQTYLLLGDQYQKMGQPDYAAAAWQIGAQKFPGDASLQKRISAQ